MLEGSWSGELFMTDSKGAEIPVWMVVIAGDSNGSDYLAYLARDLRERQQVEKLKEAFISNVSHELRTPLTSILGYAELMAEGAFGDVSPEMKDALGVVERNGDRLLHLIGQILRVAGLGEDDGEFTDIVDLGAVVSSVVASLDGIAVEHRTVVETSPSILVKGDLNELETMVSNLVANAYKFTPPGGTVRVTLHRTGGWASLEVTDTGIGIPPDDLDLIFERFHRGEEARRREIQGTGLGLAIVESVVRRHGGRITVGSEVGHGTSFRVMLPTTSEERR
jgi:signal transduction histidine kinase